MLKLGQNEILLFKSLSDVFAFDKKYKGKFIWGNGEGVIQAHGVDIIINRAGVVKIHNRFKWVYNNSGKKEIYRKNGIYDL